MKSKALTGLLLVCLLALLLALSGCEDTPEEPISRTELLLDTVCTITLYQLADPKLLDAAFELIAAEEARLSRTVEGSDVWQVNQAAGRPVTVGADTAELVALGLKYSELTGGVFDITVGSLTQLWDFGGANHVPNDEERLTAMAAVDYHNLTLDGDKLTLADPKAQLELGAIAKGYIADKVARLLRNKGVTSAIIDLGGNVLTLGEKPDGTAWNIGVQQPFGKEESELVGVIRVEGDMSLVTSGIYERNFEKDGVLYHHILDPRTGFPAETEVLGVTIVSHSSAQGDALSTTCLLLGMEEGSILLDGEDGVLGAVWVTKDGNVYVQGDIDFTLP